MTAPAPPIIIITGFMCAGKTTTASALARRLARPVVDLDRLIEEREARTVGAIIDEDGEARFREIESRALRDALAQGGARVIALGGGAWTIFRNRALIDEHGAFTVWLDAPFDLCWRRITGGGDSRPLARDRASARRLYDERRAVYEQSLLRIEAGEGRSADEIAAEIIDALPK
jgi:shikimate kinase